MYIIQRRGVQYTGRPVVWICVVEEYAQNQIKFTPFAACCVTAEQQVLLTALIEMSEGSTATEPARQLPEESTEGERKEVISSLKDTWRLNGLAKRGHQESHSRILTTSTTPSPIRSPDLLHQQRQQRRRQRRHHRRHLVLLVFLPCRRKPKRQH